MAGEVLPEDQINPELQDAAPDTNQGFAFVQDILNDPQKRLYAFIAAAALILGLIVFIAIGPKNSNENQGKLVPLVQELDQSRAFEIVAKLKSVNIDAQVKPSEKPGEYTTYVYEKAVESSYLALSRTNLLEDDDYGLFDQNDWAASDYDKKIKLSRAINGDLSRIISRMEGVRSAIVRVYVPDQNLFSDLQADTTATVQIELENDGEELGKAQVRSIVNILRGYLPNLEKDKISIVDTAGHSYNVFKEEDESSSDDFIEEVERVNKLIRNRIRKYLDVVVGDSLYEVSVSASITREKVEQQKTVYSEGTVGKRQKGTERLNAGAGGVAGPGTGSNKNYENDTVNETLLPSFEQNKVVYLPGKVSKVSVALALDKTVPNMISLEQLQESVAAIVGPEANAKDIKLTIVDLQARNNPGVISAGESKEGFWAMLDDFFRSSIWSGLSKVLTVIGIIIGILITGIIGLNFVGAATNQNYSEEDDDDLTAEFDQIFDTDDDQDIQDDFGEKKALEQQEALLKEMMNSSGASTSEVEKSQGTSYSEDEEEETKEEKVEFDNLINDFQSVASAKPEILAKKIQVWLDEE